MCQSQSPWLGIGLARSTAAGAGFRGGPRHLGRRHVDRRRRPRAAGGAALCHDTRDSAGGGVVDTVYNAAGAAAVYEGHLLQRHFQGIHMISQHLQARLANYELVGRHWLGLPVDETRL